MDKAETLLNTSTTHSSRRATLSAPVWSELDTTMRLPLSMLMPSPVRHGLKTGLAVVLAYAVTHILDLQMWQWAVVAAVVTMQMTVADAIQNGVNRITGTIIGAALGIAFLYIFPSGEVWMGLALWAGAALCASLSQYSQRYTMAALTVVVVVLAGAGAEDKIAVGLGRMAEIGIGVCCSFLVSVVLWPIRLADALRRDLASQYLLCADHLNTLVSAFLNRQLTLDHHMLEPLVDKAWNNHELFLRVQKHESIIFQYDQDILKVQVRTLDRAVSHLKPMLESLNDYEGRQGFDVIMAPDLRRLADAVMTTLRHLGGNSPAAPVPDLVRTLTELVDITEKRLGSLRNEGATNRFNLHQMLQFFTFFHSLRGMAADLLFTLDKIQNRKT